MVGAGWIAATHRDTRLTWRVVGAIAHERGHAHGSYVTAALPLLLAATLAAVAVGRLRRDWSWSALRSRAWRWLVWSSLLLCSAPLVEALRLAFDRPDPTESLRRRHRHPRRRQPRHRPRSGRAPAPRSWPDRTRSSPSPIVGAAPSGSVVEPVVSGHARWRFTWGATAAVLGPSDPIM